LKTVSIVIPCLNESAYILKCLSAIIKQSYPENLITTYICDGNSNDGTIEIIKSFTSNHKHFKLLTNLDKTTPKALNLGIKNADSDIIIILGAHSEIDKDFVRCNVETFELDQKIMCAGGVLENIYENNISKIIGAAMSSSFGVGNAHFRTGNKNGYVDTVAFGAYKKEIFEEIGLFDEELERNQDDEFNFRLTAAGYKIYLNSDIKCNYYVRASFSKLFKQYFQYGYWKVYVNKKHKTITTTRQLVPLLFTLYIFAFILSLFINNLIFLILLPILVLYFITGTYFAINMKLTFSEKLGVLYTFLILHLGYGLGYLKGIIKLILLNQSIKKNEISTR
jgi:cellulose synthase/poly-beta-1,6-N-acetylglucosamine synthase-like glycosyltransferase